MVEDLAGFQIEEFLVARILEHERLAAVAHDHPIALANLQLGSLRTLPALTTIGAIGNAEAAI